MKRLAQWLGSAIAVAALIFLFSAKPVFADSYTVFNLGDDSGRGLYGIDTSGDVVIWGDNGCGSSFICYTTYSDGVAISTTATPPDLVYDDGTSCSAAAGFNTSKQVCNNGWIGLGSLYSPNGDKNGVYTGSGSNLSYLASGSADQVVLNSLGDMAWTDGRDDEMYVAILNAAPLFNTADLATEPEFAAASTPEPGSLFRVCTGLFGFLAAVLRKANRPPVTFID